MKNRQHIISIFKIRLIIQLILLAYFIGDFAFIFQSFKDLDLWTIAILVGLGVYLLTITYIWFRTTYILEADRIIFQKYLRFKTTNLVMHYSKVSAVNASSSLMYRIFNVSRVSITSNTSVGNDDDSIDIVISNKKYEEIKDIIEQYKEEDYIARSDYDEYSYGIFSYLLYVLVFFIPYVFAIALSIYILYLIKDYVFNNEFTLELTITAYSVALWFVIEIFLKTRNLINLNVLIDRTKSLINTSSKFLAESEIEFRMDRIKVVKVHTFKLYNRSAISAGVVNSLEQIKDVVNPKLSCLLNDETRDEILNELGVNYQPTITFKPVKIRQLYNFILFILASSILGLIAIVTRNVFNNNVIALICLILMSVVITLYIFRVLAIAKTESCSLNDDYVIVSKKYYENINSIFSYNNIQMIAITQSLLDRIFKVHNIQIGIFSYNKSEVSMFKLKTYSKQDCEYIFNYIETKING